MCRAGLVPARLMPIELVDTVHRGESFSNPGWKHGKRQSNVRLERLAGMAQATRQQVRNMHGLIETMKEREYVPGESKITDDRITDALRGMAEPNGLTDAVIAKIIRPDMGFDEFESIAGLEEKASYDVFDTLRAIMLPSGYDVSHAMARAFKQDIPRLFEQFAILIHPASERAGAYLIAATISYLEGDPTIRCKHFADMLFRVKPEDEMLRNLSTALIHGVEPDRPSGIEDPSNIRNQRMDNATLGATAAESATAIR